MSLDRPLVRAFQEGTTGSPSGDPFGLALVFRGVAGLTVAPCPAALHARPPPRPAGPRPASHAAPGDFRAAFAAAPSPPSGRQPVTASELGQRSFATIQLREEPPSRTRHQQ